MLVSEMIANESYELTEYVSNQDLEYLMKILHLEVIGAWVHNFEQDILWCFIGPTDLLV
jgi:hypothetical protein